jgi:predicted transcriptional regulator
MKYLNLDQKICCNDVIQWIFDLNQLDITVYKKLRKAKEIRPQTLAKQLNKERSTVYRSLQKLTCAGLCIKKTNTIPSGGYYHVYTSKNSDEIQKNLEVCIDKWYKKMKITIKQLK